MSINDKPLVSVVMITYGHEKYIREAIEGVFLQETNFLVELIISNDCSPDNTDAIVKETILNAPENIKVKYIRHPNNLGMAKNFIKAIEQAQGKYLAICEGDDYWINKDKLQIQVDFLERNVDYAICCHNVYFINGREIINNNVFDTYTKETYSIEDLSKENFIPTLSSLFRNIKIHFPEWYYTSIVGDYPLWFWISQKGKIMFLKEKMGVYRQNVGVWSGKPKNYKKMIELYHNLSNDFSENKIIKNNLYLWKKRYIKAFLKNQSIVEIFKNPYFKELTYFEKVKLLIMNLFKRDIKLFVNQVVINKIGGG